MVRPLSVLAIVALLTATAGCTMCAHPLDYYGPVYCGGTHPPGAQNVRAGSILSPPATMSMPAPAPVIEPLPAAPQTEPEPQKKAAEPPREDAPAADKVLESTDGKAEPTLAPPLAAQSAPTGGWTARRPEPPPQ